MVRSDNRDATQEFEKARRQAKDRKEKYVLTLYIASMNARTRFAIENIKKICEEHLKGRYELDVVDLRENPSLAIKEEIVGTPLLKKKLPAPLRKFIGNLGDADKILVGLDLTKKEKDQK